jgi:molybdopterin converting factor small subunit
MTLTGWQMSIAVRLSPPLRRLVDGRATLTIGDCSTTGDCLAQLASHYPSLGKDVRKDNGDVSDDYVIYVNGLPAYPEELTTPVKDGDSIQFVMGILTGG